jgi:hypothetical protein
MEQVTIQSVTAKKTGAKNGKPWTISEVTTSDGRKFDTFDTFTAGESANVDITPNANPQYIPNIKRAKSAGQMNAGNFKNAEVANKAIEANIAKDERISMLSCISSACTYYAQRGQANEEQVISFAKKLFDVAVKRVDDLPFVISIFCVVF